VADLKLDTEQLRDTAELLSSMAAEFEKANENVATTASAVGDDTLKHAVERFASSWNQHREELTEQITKLRDHLVNAADSIEAADLALADGLDGDG
jgi:gas vesicle protein